MGIPHFRKPPYTEQHRCHHARHYHICHHWQDDSNTLEPCSLGILRTLAALDMFACVISKGQWFGLRENLQETMVFTVKYGGFL